MTNMIENSKVLAGAQTSSDLPKRRAKPLLLHFTGPTGQLPVRPRDDDLGPARRVRRGHGVFVVSGEAREHEPDHLRGLLVALQWKMVHPESGFEDFFRERGVWCPLCLCSEHRGWLWGSTVNLLEDVKVDDVDHSHFFTVNIGDIPCISAPASKTTPFAAAAAASASAGRAPYRATPSSSLSNHARVLHHHHLGVDLRKHK
mmetsp:Transcript_2537/g.5196  ORF Transcript_2537/g.5196 Transcript_2537/m.5196 type:complete len:202 (-) Transcript_2537:47-652(-)